jgi:hypothetical protein
MQQPIGYIGWVQTIKPRLARESLSTKRALTPAEIDRSSRRLKTTRLPPAGMILDHVGVIQGALAVRRFYPIQRRACEILQHEASSRFLRSGPRENV